MASQLVLPFFLVSGCIFLAPKTKAFVTSLYLGRETENNPNILRPIQGLYIGYKDWQKTRGLYYFHRDRAISDAVHEGYEETLGPELENELDTLYVEYLLEKVKQQKQVSESGKD